jgi:hypothetical protein
MAFKNSGSGMMYEIPVHTSILTRCNRNLKSSEIQFSVKPELVEIPVVPYQVVIYGLYILVGMAWHGMGFPSLEITERLILAHLYMLDEKKCFSSNLSSGWHGFSSGFPSENPFHPSLR